VIHERWTGKDTEGSGHGLTLKSIPSICLEKLRKPRRTSVGITGLRAETWTRDLTNTKQEVYISQNFWSIKNEEAPLMSILLGKPQKLWTQWNVHVWLPFSQTAHALKHHYGRLRHHCHWLIVILDVPPLCMQIVLSLLRSLSRQRPFTEIHLATFSPTELIIVSQLPYFP
jgi:hypothetical protein